MIGNILISNKYVAVIILQSVPHSLLHFMFVDVRYYSMLVIPKVTQTKYFVTAHTHSLSHRKKPTTNRE